MSTYGERQFETSPTAYSDVDPGWSEAWWWLWTPIAVLVVLLAINAVSPGFYRVWIHPEGSGVLELSHFLLPLAGLVVALRLFFLPQVKAWPLLRAAIGVFVLACLFIAGEETSWGQWFFHWNTPEYWSQLNKQKETNLHNAFHIFNKVPRVLLEVAVIVGGLVLPLSARARALFPQPIMQLLIPPLALVPVSVMSVLMHLYEEIQKQHLISREARLLPRPGEVMETYFYMFILFYLIILSRRVRAMGVAQS